MSFNKIFLILIVIGILSCAPNVFAQGGADGLGGKPTSNKTPPKSALPKSVTPPKKSVGNPSAKAGTGGGTDGPGTTFRNSLDGETLVVSYKSESGNVIFTLEAISDFTNDLKDDFSSTSNDYSYIWIDGNKNSKWDCKDFTYSASKKITETEVPRCNGYKSSATVKVSFTGTTAESRPHPVWAYAIPKSELGGSGIVHVRFECFNGSSSVFGLGVPDRGTAPDPGFGNVKRIRIN